MQHKDWICACEYKNHERNKKCRKCNRTKPKGGEAQDDVDVETRRTKKGTKDKHWTCGCGYENFSERTKCRNLLCEKPRARPAPKEEVGARAGDWFCESCQKSIWASKPQCTKCGTHRPDVAKLLESKEKDTEGRCIACLSAKANMVVTLCGHLCLCEKCSAEVDKCPMCRKVFSKDKNLLRVFGT